ncbi:unnamed protein product [Xylocopa violacea]|uniref:BAG domain-containing protein n=3 Tax=Xylocopa violacea TaxID=135666 RepID=A0ABP1PGL8_XYLVO
MDSPVIVDKASEFGEPIDLDRPFPAFPFDDDGFGRRSDIRAHLDDLAARHPEFADHLLGPPWGDIPFHGTFRNRNRDSGNGGRNSFQQGYSDEDARSQASGSSAASGTSASSHGEAEANQNHQDKSSSSEQTDRRSQIPQYGLRNTVDIGQHHHNMENPDRGNRSQRSMSAPPENRQSVNQQQPQQQDQQTQPQGQQRYVSRIDITPQHNQPQQQQKTQQQPQQPQQPQQKPQQQSTVRHIPIFVEGRDEPVIPRSFEESPHFRREPSPTQFHAPPHFAQRSSPFGQHFGGRHQWSPHFQESFYPPSGSFEHPSRRQQQSHTFQHPRQQQFTERQPQKEHYEQPRQQRSQQQPQQQPQQPQQQQQQETPKPKPALPKDPLERVALVQKEVDSLAEQVKQYSGNSRTDKQYIYLDEMLTRELIKLDDIETEGRDNVRQARKNAIKTIQETISLLESKAPLPSQQTSPEEQEKQEDQALSNPEEAGQTESMDVHQKPEESQTKEPIPLPPGPSSPTKKSTEANEPSTEKVEDSGKDQTENVQQEDKQTSDEPIDTAPSDKQEIASVEVEQNSEQASVTEEKKEAEAPDEKEQESTAEEKKTGVAAEKAEENVEQNKVENIPEEQKAESASEEKKADDTGNEKKKEKKGDEKENISKEKESEKTDNKQSGKEKQQKPEKMEVESEVKQSPKSQKKGKKTKKQAPVSDKPIPLPAPESTETNAK